MEKLCAVSVDLDEIDCYAAIHGLLDRAPERGLSAVYDRALPRLARLFAELDIPATFFVIGRHLARAENRAQLRALHDAGHEIGNHSQHHFYDLTRRAREEMLDEVRAAADGIEAAVGARPVGFRAPGYTVNDTLLDVLVEAGVTYDSSVFPCPAYYAAKATAIGLIRARGRRSHSVVDHPRVLTAPTQPYRMGRPYTTRGQGLIELPIAVTSNLTGRLPFIGTSVVLSQPRAARRLSRWASAQDFVNLELHGIDLSDAREDGLDWLVPHQPDLRRTRQDKEASLRAAIGELKARNFRFVTLAEVAARA